MADINQTYGGVVEQIDPDAVIARLPGFWPWSPPRLIYLPEEERVIIRNLNAQATSTVNAVKVEFTGTTNPERLSWLNERITAINERVKFIKSRTDSLLSTLQDRSNDSYSTLTKLVTSALAVVPVVGSVASYAQNQVTQGQSLETFKLQSQIQDYAADLQQLGTIRAGLLNELNARPTTTVTTPRVDPTQEAPFPTTYYYYAGAALLLILFVWYRRRKRSNSRRR